jgi:hypothetical protein
MADERARLQGAVEELLSSKQDSPELVPAAMGAYINGSQTIEVAARPGFIWCRIRSQTSERVMAFNAEPGVAHHWDLPILVTRDPKFPDIWKVAGRDIARYTDWGENSSPYLPPHGRDHSFGGGTDSGNDIVWAFKRQFMPLLPMPKATGTLSIDIGQDFYYFGGRFRWFEGTGTATLDSYKPTGGYNARFVTIYIDGPTGELDYLSGDEFNTITPPVDPGEFISIPSPDTGFAVAAVWLATGTTSIGWRNIYDLRIPNAPPAGTGSLIGIYDEGTFMGGVRNFNYIGAGVNVVVSGTYAHVTVTAGGQGIFGLDDGVPLGTGTTVNWGDGVGASISGSVFDVYVEEDYPFTWTAVHTFQNRTLFEALAGFGNDIRVTGSIYLGTNLYFDDDDYLLYDKGANSLEFRFGGIAFLGVGTAQMSYGYADNIFVAYQGGGFSIGRAFYNPGFDNLAVTGDVIISGSYTTAEWIDTLDQAADPAAPAAGYGRWYSKGGIAYFEAPGGTIYDLTATGSGGGADPPTTGTIVISDEGVVLGSATELDFVGGGVTATLNGTVATIEVLGGTGTYVRAGSPTALASETGTAWQIPEGEFMTGTLSLMINGIWQEPVVDYQEQFAASGTFTLTEAPPTGSVFAVIWGAPDTSGGAGVDGILTGSIDVYDDSVFQVEAHSISFDENLDVSVTGGFAYVDSTPATIVTGTYDVGVVLLDDELSGAQASFYASGSFSDYEYIEIILTGRKSTNGSGLIYIALNEDAADANYQRTQHQAEAGAHNVTEAQDRYIGFVPGLDGPANVSGFMKATIPDPGNTTFYTNIHSLAHSANPITDLYVLQHGVIWKNTAAITEIRLTLSADNFVAGSRCKIKGYREQVVVISA